MAQFDPSEKDVDTVLKHLEKADSQERSRVLAAEVTGKKRKTVLEKYGIDPDARYDATGRLLYPWEVTGKDMADAGRQPEESDEARERREAEAKLQESSTSTPQLGSTPAASGVAPAAGTTSGGTASTVATPAGGRPAGS